MLRTTLKVGLVLLTAVALLPGRTLAASAMIYAEDFESYAGPATALSDNADADPSSAIYNVTDDVPFGSPSGTGVQLINWQSHTGSKSLLLRSGSQIMANLPNAHSGSSYQLDFWVNVSRVATSDRNFRISLQGEGADYNGDDYLAYRVQNAVGGTAMQYYDGVGPGTAAWVIIPGANQLPDAWQHHRLVINPNAVTFDLYIDDMTVPLFSGGDLSRVEVAVPTRLVIHNEGNTDDDGYFAIDDITLTVQNTIDLGATYTDGFEAYPARTSLTDDADPQGPWITTETDGTGAGKPRAPVKVQVVDATVVTPHSGSKCLKLEYGQRAGASLAWGTPTNVDVQVTWWARVPATLTGGQYVYLRMSLYGTEDGSTYAGDNALLGYGCRDATLGDSTSLTYYQGSAWLDSGIDFTPDTWEEYRLITHNTVGSYTLIKSPSSNPQVIVERKQLLGGGWGPTFMAAWSSSNGTNHPPVYIDDIEVKTLNASPNTQTIPYAVNLHNNRFTNCTSLALAGPVGAVAVDPRDNSTILFTIEKAANGGIYKAAKASSGNWTLDPTPVVSGLASPSGLTVGADGTLWWTHDNSTAIMRLKTPWASNTPEKVISDFGVLSGTGTAQDDDPFDICYPPAQFTGSIGNSGHVVIMDRGVDSDPMNALQVLDAATTVLNQTVYKNYLFGPSQTDLGAKDLVALTPLPPSEVATLNLDGQVSAVDGNGTKRDIWPDFYRDPYVAIQPAAIAVDPVSGRLWIADDTTNQVWSCNTVDGSEGAREISFVVTNSTFVEQLDADFAEPGMAFSPNGNILVVSDSRTIIGQGRLLIFHNEPIMPAGFSITSYTKTPDGMQLTWQAAGSVKYRVQRTTNLSVPMVDISGDLTATSFTDTNVPGGAFYRVVARP